MKDRLWWSSNPCFMTVLATQQHSHRIEMHNKIQGVIKKKKKKGASVWTYLDENVPEKWIGPASDNDNVLLKWPLGSLNLTLYVFFYGAM